MTGFQLPFGLGQTPMFYIPQASLPQTGASTPGNAHGGAAAQPLMMPMVMIPAGFGAPAAGQQPGTPYPLVFAPQQPSAQVT